MERHTQATVFIQGGLPEMLLVNIAALGVELMEELNMTSHFMCDNGKCKYKNGIIGMTKIQKGNK
jgi:hypothetical protein